MAKGTKRLEAGMLGSSEAEKFEFLFIRYFRFISFAKQSGQA
jgi:hypothetical protein